MPSGVHQPDIRGLLREVEFIASRSAGPGGQNVNKVNTKVTLRFNVIASTILSDEQRAIVFKKLENKLSKDGLLIITSQDARSQVANKASAIAKFESLIKKAFYVPRVRKKTKPSKASQQKRIKAKKIRGEKKDWRKKPD